MKYSELFVGVMALVGIVTWAFPPDDPTTLVEPMLLMCKVAVCVALFTFVPKLINMFKNGVIVDFLTVTVFPAVVITVIYILNPNVDENLLKYVFLSMLIVCGLVGGVLKRYFVKKWGVEVNSYHPDNTN